jgi:hypothetical protein
LVGKDSAVLHKVKENLPSTDHRFVSLYVFKRYFVRNTRNIPIKIESHSGEQNGKWHDPQFLNLHTEAFKIEPLTEQRPVSIRLAKKFFRAKIISVIY